MKLSQKTLLELFGFKSRNTLSDWKNSSNRKIFELVNKYFNEEDILEFLETGKIRNIELIKDKDILIKLNKIKINELQNEIEETKKDIEKLEKFKTN